VSAAAQDEDEEMISGINVTPLVDITLVLLIVFMATAHIITHRSLSLALPKVAHSDALATETQQVVLAADKTVLLNNERVSLEDLAAALGKMGRLDPALKVTVLADEKVSWGDMAGVLDVVRGAGITRIATEVQPKPAR
jgi:biopolymer transport protein ExbD